MRNLKNKHYFKDHDYTFIGEIITMEKPGQIVKVWCNNYSLERPTINPGTKQNVVSSSAIFTDIKGNTIGSDYFTKKIHDQLKKYQDSIKPIEILARVQPDSDNGPYNNELKILKVRLADSPLKHIGASKHEKSLLKKFTRKIRKKINDHNRWALLESYIEAIIEKCKIVGTNSNPQFKRALSAIVGQAFSTGVLCNTNGKIHICLIGPPSSGKGRIWDGIKLINPVCEEAHPSRTTGAGLTGAMKKTRKQRGITGGKIVLAHGGVFGIQDFDKMRDKQEVIAVFTMVMEDGECILSGANAERFEANTAIYIDLNRASDLFLDQSRTKNITTDLGGIGTQLFSRFDIIIEFFKDTERQLDTSIQMLGFHEKMDSNSELIGFCRENDIPANRFIKLVTAYVLESYPKIEDNSIKEYAQQKLNQLIETNKDQLDAIDDLSQFLPRIANTVIKLIHSYARLQLTNEANKEAVDKAFELLSAKFHFLKNIVPKLNVPQYTHDPFCDWLWKSVEDEFFSPKAEFKSYQDEGSPCGEIKLRSFRNWIEKYADKAKHNEWKLKKEICDFYKNTNDQ